MASLTLADPAGTRVKVTLNLNSAMLAFLAHKGFVVLSSTPA